MPIALDATYSLGRNLSGVGVYSREMLFGLAAAHPEEEFLWCYRSHRFLRSYRERVAKNAVRRLLVGPPPADLFHALNQRVDVRANRTVTTFHDLFVLTGDYSSPEFRARFAAQAREAAERSDVIIAVSRFTAAQIENLLKIPLARIRVVPHGVHLPDPFTTPRENLVLFVGAIQRRKNVARLVQAFARMPRDWRLVLAGASDGYGAEAEFSAIDRSPRRASIDVLGYISTAQLRDLYRRARIFAFPSLDEGFGMPVLEAMAHGIPVVTSNCSALPEVAGDAALLVDPQDTESIAAALVSLAGNESQRDDFSRRGLERARMFSWKSAVDRTWAVYDEIR
ncbi:MAG: glycosyltransferase family 4 protein [Acidobacteriia bacterium]|nr:glycosyltransferase family 4 protein [Terriglobia bacterium]